MPYGFIEVRISGVNVLLTDAAHDEPRGLVCIAPAEIEKVPDCDLARIVREAVPYAEAFNAWGWCKSMLDLGFEYLKHDPELPATLDTHDKYLDAANDRIGFIKKLRLSTQCLTEAAALRNRLRSLAEGKAVKREATARRRSEFAKVRYYLVLGLIDRDGYRCDDCGFPEDLTVDHIIPLSRGGTDSLENCRFLCRSCNSRKGDRVSKEGLENGR